MPLKTRKKVKVPAALTGKELDALRCILDLFEHQTERNTGVHRISGGFARAGMSGYDDEYIGLELKWGIQSDCEYKSYTENWKLERRYLECETAVALKNIEEA